MLLNFILVYLLLGVCIAPGFVIWGAGRIDPAAGSAEWGVRVLWLPAAAILWPCVLRRWLAGRVS
jgi:hypothetical protein